MFCGQQFMVAWKAPRLAKICCDSQGKTCLEFGRQKLTRVATDSGRDTGGSETGIVGQSARGYAPKLSQSGGVWLRNSSWETAGNCLAESERICCHYRTTRLSEHEGGTFQHQSPHWIVTREFIGFANVPVLWIEGTSCVCEINSVQGYVTLSSVVSF